MAVVLKTDLGDLRQRSHAAQVSCNSLEEGITVGRTYLCYFLHRYLDFRHAEVQSLVEVLGSEQVTWGQPFGGSRFSPFWYLRLPSEEVAKKVAERSMLIKGFYEVWGEGETWEELQASLESFPHERREAFLAEDVTWKIMVDGWGRSINQSEQIEMINRLAFLNIKGPIKLTHPDVTFWLIVVGDNPSNGLPNGAPPRMYFGREVAVSNRRVIQRYALPQRAYIGPTSMDTEMAFVMCNQAKVQRGHLVFDPFVGTGSILVAAAHLGAHTMGSDIDIRILRDGKVDAHTGQVRDNWTNFREYRLTPPLGLLRSDAHFPPFRETREGFLDAIVCDPPYGVRAGGRKSVSGTERGDTVPRTTWRGEGIGDWVPPTCGYGLGECLRDLLDISARLLRLGGRLVYFLPAAPDAFLDDNVPSHPALRYISNCEQVLSRRYSRRLITMEKCSAYDAVSAAAHHASNGNERFEEQLAKIHELVYENRREGSQHGPDGNGLTKPKFRGKLT